MFHLKKTKKNCPFIIVGVTVYFLIFLDKIWVKSDYFGKGLNHLKKGLFDLKLAIYCSELSKLHFRT